MTVLGKQTVPLAGGEDLESMGHFLLNYLRFVRKIRDFVFWTAMITTIFALIGFIAGVTFGIKAVIDKDNSVAQWTVAGVCVVVVILEVVFYKFTTRKMVVAVTLRGVDLLDKAEEVKGTMQDKMDKLNDWMDQFKNPKMIISHVMDVGVQTLLDAAKIYCFGIPFLVVLVTLVMVIVGAAVDQKVVLIIGIVLLSIAIVLCCLTSCAYLALRVSIKVINKQAKKRILGLKEDPESPRSAGSTKSLPGQ